MKINEIVIEAVNPSTGTPNADPERGWDQDTYTGHVDPNTVQMPDFSGLTQAAQGAKMLGKGIARGAKNLYRTAKQSYALSSAKKAGGQNLQMEFDNWKKYKQMRGAVMDMSQIRNFQNELRNWANSRYTNVKDALDVRKVKTARDAERYITGMYSAAMANIQNPNLQKGNTPKTPAPADNSPETDQPTTSPIVGADGKPLSRSVATDPGKPVPHSPAEPTHDLVKGAQIIQQDPIIIKHKNKEYGLNDNGQWVHFGSTKVPHQSFQAFLDNQAGFAPQQMEESVDIGQVLWDKMKRKQ